MRKKIILGAIISICCICLVGTIIYFSKSTKPAVVDEALIGQTISNETLATNKTNLENETTNALNIENKESIGNEVNGQTASESNEQQKSGDVNVVNAITSSNEGPTVAQVTPTEAQAAPTEAQVAPTEAPPAPTVAPPPTETQSAFLTRLYKVGLVDFLNAKTLADVTNIIGNQGVKIKGAGSNEPLAEQDTWQVAPYLTITYVDTTIQTNSGYAILLDWYPPIESLFKNTNVINLPVDDVNTYNDLSSDYNGKTYQEIKNHFASGTDGVLFVIHYDSNPSNNPLISIGMEYCYFWDNNYLDSITAVFDDRNCTSVVCTSHNY